MEFVVYTGHRRTERKRKATKNNDKHNVVAYFRTVETITFVVIPVVDDDR